MLKKSFLIVSTFLLLFCSGQAMAQVVMLTATDWPPYTSSDLPENGFYSEITIEALKRMGYEPQLIIMPWKRALEMTTTGEFDGLLGASFTKERTRYFIYPRYFWAAAIHFFTRSDNDAAYTNPEALCPAVLGILRGSLYVDRFHKIKCLRIDAANSVSNNITKLSHSRIDYMIDSRDAVFHLLNGELKNVKNVRIMEPRYEIDKIYTVFSKKSPLGEKLATDFDRGIELLKADGTYDSILRKHGIRSSGLTTH